MPVQVVEVNQGPAVTQFGLRPGSIIRKDRKGEEKQIKVRVSQIQALSNDLSLALAASPIRIEAPVPGRDFVGVEVPNVQISQVSLRGVMESEEFMATKGPLLFGLGRDVSGQPMAADLARMPHLLIAGATGSGKSVCINALISSMLLRHTPDTLRFLMVDPKRVELTVYNGIPHLIAPVVVDVERAVPVLQWATREMERRYKLFAKLGARNIEGYNEKQAARGEPPLPYIVIVIDELADLMLSAPEDVERYICRIAQMARATGMHLVLATQRPSVDVVTGLIKANFPARIAFAVTSQVDSRVIIDTPGAEQLLGRGDMLFMAPDSSKLLRLQGCWVSDRETHRLVQYWKGARAFTEPEALMADEGGQYAAAGNEAAGPGEVGGLEPPWLPGQEALQQPLWEDVAASQSLEGRDDMYRQAVEEVRRAGKASISLLQRRLRIGYSRAARLIDQMEADGIVGPELGGTRGREILPERTQNQASS
ncbi:MAG: DNA translocase SpoIIIE [Chloroflexi bacterium ADurb.Bin325]|nr:MAG: DNA translocase SpoIIIE [Chloroflexi bacterium ADurb.Bin325]